MPGQDGQMSQKALKSSQNQYLFFISDKFEEDSELEEREREGAHNLLAGLEQEEGLCIRKALGFIGGGEDDHRSVSTVEKVPCGDFLDGSTLLGFIASGKDEKQPLDIGNTLKNFNSEVSLNQEIDSLEELHGSIQ